MQTIQYFSNEVEYTTRYELAQKYPTLSYNRLQRLLEQSEQIRVTHKNQFYFEKAAIEEQIENMLRK